ncbi:MAG: GNAT family N-acetyltransferase [Anaeroplasmataceae bacterium]
MKIVTKRLTIRYFENSDLDDFYEFSKPQIVGYNAGWKPHDNISMSQRILFNKVMSANNFAIVINETKKVIGSIELNKSHIREGVKAFEIGFALNPLYWGMGYAKEATIALMDFAFKKQHAEVIEMCHITDNIRCENTIKSLGFIYEGTLVKYKRMYDNRVVDVKTYRMTKEEYERMY